MENELHNAADDIVSFEPAVLKHGRTSPANVISLIMKVENSKRCVKFVVKRDLSVRLRSYTLAYRFSPEPIENDAENEPFSTVVYDHANINAKEIKVFSGAIPDSFDFHGCDEFISEVEYADGTKEVFENTDFATPGNETGFTPDAQVVPEIPKEERAKARRDFGEWGTAYFEKYNDAYDDMFSRSPDEPFDDGIEWAENAADYAAFLDPANQASDGSARIANGADSYDQDGYDEPMPKKRHYGLVIIPILILLALLFGGGGVYMYAKNGVESTVDSLIAQGRYTEAYYIAEDKKNSELSMKAVYAAVEHYLAVGDLKSAYTFASISNECDRVTEKAIEEIVSLGENAIGSEEFSVAVKSKNDEAFDNAISSITDTIASSNDFERAMNTTSFIRSDTARDEKAVSVYRDGLAFYIKNNDADGAITFIRRYGELRSFEGAVSDDEITKIISSCMKNGDSANAVFLAKYFGRDYAGIEIIPDDPGVRAALADVYPLLTEQQKRIYHSNNIACYKESFFIEDGAIEGTDITDAIGIDTYEYRTTILHEDGHISMLPNGGHNETEGFPDDLRAVQVVCGQHHSVALLADGTCRAFGQNEYGQCNVGEWENVAQIAAGRNFTVALLTNGTLVACGSNLEHQCDVGDYRNAVEVFACDQTTVILFSDGTVHIQGDGSFGLHKANELKNVEKMSCHANTIAVKHTDGNFTVICASPGSSAGAVIKLQNASVFAAGNTCVAYADENGTLNVIGDGAPKRYQNN